MTCHEIGLLLLGGGITLALIGAYCGCRAWAEHRQQRRYKAGCAAYDRVATAYRSEARLTAMPVPVEALMCGGALLFSPASYPRLLAERGMN